MDGHAKDCGDREGQKDSRFAASMLDVDDRLPANAEPTSKRLLREPALLSVLLDCRYVTRHAP